MPRNCSVYKKRRRPNRKEIQVRCLRPTIPLKFATVWLILFTCGAASDSSAAEKLVALYSSHAVPYSMPWIAEELGLFKKYDLDFGFVYIPSSSTATECRQNRNRG